MVSPCYQWSQKNVWLIRFLAESPGAVSSLTELFDLAKRQCPDGGFKSIRSLKGAMYSTRLSAKTFREQRLVFRAPFTGWTSAMIGDAFRRYREEGVVSWEKAVQKLEEEYSLQLPSIPNRKFSLWLTWNEAFYWGVDFPMVQEKSKNFFEFKGLIEKSLVAAIESCPASFSSWDDVILWIREEFGVEVTEKALGAANRDWGISLVASQHHKRLVRQSGCTGGLLRFEYEVSQRIAFDIIWGLLLSQPNDASYKRALQSLAEHPYLVAGDKGKPVGYNWLARQNQCYFRFNFRETVLAGVPCFHELTYFNKPLLEDKNEFIITG